jgi:3-oxoacyl-ACP reductase-like protein
VVIEAVAVALPSKVAVAAAAFADAKDLVVQQPAEKTALTCEGTAAAVAAAAAAAVAAAAAAAAADDDDDDDDAAAAVAADVVAVDVKTKIDLNVEVPTSQLANFASSEFAGAPT